MFLLAAPDNFELQRLSNTLKNQRGRLNELEEQRIAQADVAASVMAAYMAQIQVLLRMDWGWASSWFGHAFSTRQVLADVAESLASMFLLLTV